MLKIHFEIDGRPMKPGDIADVVEQAILKQIEEHLREKIGTIRDPETGEFPTVVVSGESLDRLTIHAEGSPALLALVEERLGQGENREEQMPAIPRAFLCYGTEDKPLAEKIASAMQSSRIDTWWANWCISAGDSLRQRIDEGLGDCTHFIVLLTPTSIKKPWVNQEMDAGLIRKLNNHCKFIPLRHRLPVSQLPPLLSGMSSPEVVDPERDIGQLIHDIHGITRKPPLGEASATVSEAKKLNTGYSAAASAIAKLFVERTATATFGDPQMLVTDLQEATGLSEEDVEDAIHELSGKVQLTHECVLPKEELFATFDQFWKEWNPADDALRLAADLVNDKEFPRILPQIAECYGWEARRLNPAVAYLINRDIVSTSQVMGTQPWLIHWIEDTADTRRFVRSRS
jgi:hypothetical protein